MLSQAVVQQIADGQKSWWEASRGRYAELLQDRQYSISDWATYYKLEFEGDPEDKRPTLKQWAALYVDIVRPKFLEKSPLPIWIFPAIAASVAIVGTFFKVKKT